MNSKFISLTVLSILLQSSLVIYAQSSLTRPNLNPGPVIELADQEQFLNYWTAEGGWHSELQLRNNLPDEDLIVTPVLRSLDGSEIPLPPVKIKPQAVRTINLSSVIDASAPEFANKYGSVVLRYHSAAQRNLYAAMMLHDTGYPIAFHIDAMGESADYDLGSREGIWWLPSAATSHNFWDWLRTKCKPQPAIRRYCFKATDKRHSDHCNSDSRV